MPRQALCAVLLSAALTACSSKAPPVPSNVFIGARALPTPQTLAPNAPARILAASFSALDVRRGSAWRARFVTSTNTASLEVRTNLFSIDVPKAAPGRFLFTLDVLDVPPIFVRSYRLRVIARNAAGTTDEEDMPFRIR